MPMSAGNIALMKGHGGDADAQPMKGHVSTAQCNNIDAGNHLVFSDLEIWRLDHSLVGTGIKAAALAASAGGNQALFQTQWDQRVRQVRNSLGVGY